jgi:hypothetical protein
MTQDQISARLLLTSEICQQLQLYAQEITRENASRAFLESFASRALKCCAVLYTLSRPEPLATSEAQPVSQPENVLPLRGGFEPALNAAVLHAVDTTQRREDYNP